MARQIGLQFQNRRYYVYYVNGNRHGPLMEDSQVPGADMLKEYWPNDNNGILYKNHAWFEGDVALQSSGYMNVNNESFCLLGRYTTTIKGVPNQYKLARYRWMWWIRQFGDSANDFSQLYALIDAANTPTNTPTYFANMESQVDTEQWLRLSAVEHATGDLDSFFTLVHWNMYCYKPTMGKWTALKWDWNISLGSGGGWWGPDTANLFTFSTTDPSQYGGYDPLMTAFHNYPPYRRAYLRAFQDLANLAVNNTLINPMLEAKYATFLANGLTVKDPAAPGGLETWIGTMHNSLLAELASQGVSSVAFAITSTVVSNNVAWITGTAPLAVKTVWFNGVAWPLSWSTTTNWTVGMPLQPGTNNLSVVGVDLHGQPVAGASNSVVAVYTGSSESPVGRVVINEIMYSPRVPNAGYVELYNNSTNTTFDLSGWQLTGLGYAFPPGSVLGPNAYLVLVANSSAFAGAYGGKIAIFDTFPGSLETGGQTLKLIEHMTNGLTGTVVAAVQYRGGPPWPASANGQGSSLQLIDPHQDNWRAGNWASSASSSANPSSAQWVYVTVTGTANSSRLEINLLGSGLVYLDDLKLVAGTVPESGTNLVADGDFEAPLSTNWNLGPDFTASGLSSNIVHSGNSSLQIVNLGSGTGSGDAIYQYLNPALSTGGVYTLSFWYWQTTNVNTPALSIDLAGGGLSSGPLSTGLSAAQVFAPVTPGAANGDTAVLPPFPPLWINEVQADNLTGLTNRLGGHSGWIELFNPSTNTVDLSGLYLATNYVNLSGWSFPSGTVIGAGKFKLLFADGQPGLSSADECHVGLMLNSGSGSLALSRVWQGRVQVLDYIDYTNLAPDHSYGSLPDGQSFDRQEFVHATPGTSNNAAYSPGFIPYLSVGQVYTQDFDSLPDPGTVSINSANPVTIAGITYSLANPFEFAGAPVPSGNTGGLALSALAGWYGWATATAKFGATDGDQTTGGDISFGLPASANRALGLLATATTGATAFGARFINQTGRTLNYLNLQFTGELWRQSDLPKTLEFHYWIDPSGTASFPTSSTLPLTGLDVGFPTSPGAVGGMAVDGTAPINQSNLTLLNQPIAGWPSGAALWLLWEMTSPTGKAQGLAIDNLSFSASDQPVVAPRPALGALISDNDLLLSWSSVPGTTYQIQYSEDLNSGHWLPLESPLPGTGGALTATNSISDNHQRFFRLAILPHPRSS
jgi:hypothetical protein